ncbi:hypothetical protein [Myxococcus sp. AS-1-15]|uniref:hypothetical protein n=1 Tax=Myxococcus sp. AS-1-15 TaxID=2874600 RepID=UPI001CBCEE81|nr:hypothetical protein [Myxococcus sp. AS-1-15]MBZ4400400.1 hypothetical protein [Myxococcus sp. AS-1-15]
MTCRKHPDMEQALRLAQARIAELEESRRQTAIALDRYGRHERGCRFSRSNGRQACTCLLHQRIREGGLKP